MAQKKLQRGIIEPTPSMKRIADHIKALQFKYQLLEDEQRRHGHHQDRGKAVVAHMDDALRIQYQLQGEAEPCRGPDR